MPFFCLFVCLLFIAGRESGRYFWTASAVRPGHVANWFFKISLRSVDLVGKNKDWRRYLMSSSLDVIWYALLDVWLSVLWVLCWVISQLV